MMRICVGAAVALCMVACNLNVPESEEGLTTVATDSLPAYDSAAVERAAVPPRPTATTTDSLTQDNTRQLDTARIRPGEVIDVKNLQPGQLVAFAKQQIGVPYLYGSTDPKQGFDCSGFITYVFKNFGVTVPRSSIDFTHVGKEVPVAAVKAGDIVLFTGTDSTERFVGHMGIIVSGPPDSVRFIHSTSGKAYGVTITPLNKYYQSRFVKTIRIFPQND